MRVSTCSLTFVGCPRAPCAKAIAAVASATPPLNIRRGTIPRAVAEAHKKVFRKRLRELAAVMGARHPAVLGDALLLPHGRHLRHRPAVEEGPAQSAVTVAKLLIDVSVPKT